MYSVDNFSPTRVVFGPGRLKELATVNLPGKKAMICMTNGGTLQKLGVLENVIGLLKKNKVDVVVFDEISPNPTRKNVMDVARIARENYCDFFIGLGGGSSIDTAKAAAIMVTNQGDLWDYMAIGTGKNKKVEDVYPVITITTTAGTGSETDFWCVITNEETKEKLDLGFDKLFPVLSIIDPELMLSIPKELTAFQGLDAFFHAVCMSSNDSDSTYQFS